MIHDHPLFRGRQYGKAVGSANKRPLPIEKAFTCVEKRALPFTGINHCKRPLLDHSTVFRRKGLQGESDIKCLHRKKRQVTATRGAPLLTDHVPKIDLARRI